MLDNQPLNMGNTIADIAVRTINGQGKALLVYTEAVYTEDVLLF